MLIRQDPPNMKYITATYLLGKISSKTLVLNNPSSVRNSPEKLLVTEFYNLMPPTLVTRNIKDINNFLSVNKNVLLSLYGNGGKDVFLKLFKRP